jgi:hypothetical protein
MSWRVYKTGSSAVQCASIATDKSLTELSENISQTEQRETIKLFSDQLVEAMKVVHPRPG